MGTAAVPGYLTQKFADAPPGHRFSLYFPYWQQGSWRREQDSPGKDGAPATGKVPTLKAISTLPASSQEAMLALAGRANALAKVMPDIHSIATKSIAPFATGLGIEHPLENGFAFLNPYGLPYLPGSSIKGVLRKAAEELALGFFGDNTAGWTLTDVWALLGYEASTGKDHEKLYDWAGNSEPVSSADLKAFLERFINAQKKRRTTLAQQYLYCQQSSTDSIA